MELVSSKCRTGLRSPWPDLPPELLGRIIAVLGPRDRVAVRLACSSWRACVREIFPSELPFEMPRLLIRRPGPGGELAFFSLHHRKVMRFALPRSLRSARCCGQTAGWLAMVLDSDRTIVLCNPVSGGSVALPSPPVFPVSKMLLSAPPTSPGWAAAVLGRSGTIALLQPAVSSAWTTIDVAMGARHGGFRDMALWRGRLCGLGYDGAVVAFRVDVRTRVAAASLLRDRERRLSHHRGGQGLDGLELYLVESDGELLLVRKHYQYHVRLGAVNTDVEVHLLASPEKRKWDLLEETPGRALFVGSVASAVVPVALYAPAASPLLRESCVYIARRLAEMLAPGAICECSLLDDDVKGVPIPGGHNVDVEPVWITPFV